MSLDIRYMEIMEEVTEDLELQAGLALTKDQKHSLEMKEKVIFTQSEIAPYLKDITEYLANTEPSERVWECYKIISNNTYIVAVNIDTPYIKLNAVDLNI